MAKGKGDGKKAKGEEKKVVPAKVVGTARTAANKAKRIAKAKKLAGTVKKMRVPRGTARRVRRNKDEHVLLRRSDFALMA